MTERRIPIGLLVAVGVVVLVGLIAITTYIAWRVINRTVVEQSQTSELQLVTSLSQQTQVSIGSLTSIITGLAVQEDIRASSATREEQALQSLEGVIQRLPAGTVLSITRFDFRGDPRYAYPATLHEEIPQLQSRDDYIYKIPEELLLLTSRGQRGVTGQIDVALYRVQRRDSVESAILLIAPVEAANTRTEYIVFELNLTPLFTDLFSFVDLGTTGQLWVLDGRGRVQYSARPEPDITSIRNVFDFDELIGLTNPKIDTYTGANGARQAAIARSRSLNENFVLLLSRDLSEAQAGVTNNVIGIFAFSTVAMLAVVGLGGIAGRQIQRVNRSQRDAAQRQQTARFLLDVSRALNSSLELTTVLERIMEELGDIVAYDGASVLLLQEQELRIAATRGIDNQSGIETLRLEQARAAREVIASGYPLVINDTQSDPRWSQVPGVPIAAWMGLPLSVRGRIFGVLNVNSASPHRFSPADVELAEAFADQASVALQNAQLREVEIKQIDQELSIARNIQASLLPADAPELPQLEVVSYSLPASQVSGDFFQYLPSPDGRLGIAIGDVQGKGIPAALMMAVITTAMRDEFARHSSNPAEVMQALNTRLLDRMRANHMNSALILATYDPTQHQITLSNGGMVQPYLRLPQGEAFEFVQVGGYPLGVSENMKYTEKSLDFPPGSTLVMFSDGVLEAQNPAGEFFGFERIESLLNDLPSDTTAETIKTHILAAVQSHLDTSAPQDDTTIIVLRALDVPLPATNGSQKPTPKLVDEALADQDFTGEISLDGMSAPALVSSLGGKHINVELLLPSHLGFEKIARGTAAALAREAGFGEEQVEDIKTVVAEACMNAIEHGNGEIGALSVNVQMCITGGSIEIRVTDHGLKSLAPELPEPGLGDMRGWGLFFMKNLIDVLEIRRLPSGENQVLMICNLHNEENVSADN